MQNLTLLQVGEVGILALDIWREASNQTYETMLAVGWSVKNRVDSPRWWGSSFLQVLSKKWQYSGLTAAGDPNLIRYPIETNIAWQSSLDAAYKLVTGDGLPPDPTNGADSYFDKSLDGGKEPEWSESPSAKKVADIGWFHFFKTV